VWSALRISALTGQEPPTSDDATLFMPLTLLSTMLPPAQVD
jgi:hypothetical protein